MSKGVGIAFALAILVFVAVLVGTNMNRSSQPPADEPVAEQSKPKESGPPAKSDDGPVFSWSELVRRTLSDPVAFFTAVLSFFSLGLLTVAILQIWLLLRAEDVSRTAAGAAKESAATSQQALVTVQRAFVFIDSFEYHLINNALTLIPKWRNSGTTPTRGMTNWVSMKLFDGEPPADYAYPELNGDGDIETDVTNKTQLLFVGPQSITLSDRLRLGAEDLDAVRLKHKRAFMWGWARYRDVFGIPHITRFCNEIAMDEIPATPLPDGTPQASVAVNFPFYGKYNCTDEECDLQGFPDNP
jgi:hypothetical protein